MDTYSVRIDTATEHTGEPTSCGTTQPSPPVCKAGNSCQGYRKTAAETKAKTGTHASFSANTRWEHGITHEHVCGVTG